MIGLSSQRLNDFQYFSPKFLWKARSGNTGLRGGSRSEVFLILQPERSFSGNVFIGKLCCPSPPPRGPACSIVHKHKPRITFSIYVNLRVEELKWNFAIISISISVIRGKNSFPNVQGHSISSSVDRKDTLFCSDLFVYLEGRSHSAVLSVYFWLWTQGSLLAGVKGLYGVPRMEPGLAIYKANALPVTLDPFF